MRALGSSAALLLVLAGCFPDTKGWKGGGGSPTTGAVPPPTGTGGFGAAGPGGVGGGAGGSAGAGGVSGAGGSSPPPDAGAPPTPGRAQACADFATAVATKSFQCAPFLSALLYGSMQSYTARLRMNCGYFDLPGVTFPPTPFGGCATALRAQSCEDWLDGATLAPCRSLGTKAEGASCATSYQCQTGLCDLQENGCGTCIKPPVAGEPCNDGACASGLVCNAGDICATPGSLDAGCDEHAPCQSSLGCEQGTCRRLAPVGTPCQGTQACDFYNGALCNTTRATCVPITIGSPCGPAPDGSSFTACVANGTCRMGSCQPAAADGAMCSATDGPGCQWPAFCADDSRCRIFQPNRTCGLSAPGPSDPRRALVPGLEAGEAFLRGFRGRVRF